jgi:hypothetical protein
MDLPPVGAEPPETAKASNRQVPRAEWHRFFDGFNRRHRGAIASVSVLTLAYGAQKEVTALPLEGIVADPAGGSLTIVLGGAGTFVEHPVEEPRAVWVELDDSGAERAVEIESSSESRTILEFSSGAAAMRPPFRSKEESR